MSLQKKCIKEEKENRLLVDPLFQYIEPEVKQILKGDRAVSREIKLRGIPVCGKGFVYGGYYYDKDLDQHLIINEHGTKFCVKYETVSQYTGLKDKNGKEIYEGDIVHTTGHVPNGFEMEPRHHTSVIEYWNSMYNIGYRLKDSHGKTLMIKSQGMINSMETEVIGNIYENPELLESEVKNG